MVDNKERGRQEASLLPVSNNKIGVSPRNYQELKLLFPEIEDTSIIDFQNKLNEKFAKSEYRYEDYLSQDNEDLRMFCVLNLMKNICSKLCIIHFTPSGFGKRVNDVTLIRNCVTLSSGGLAIFK